MDDEKRVLEAFLSWGARQPRTQYSFPSGEIGYWVEEFLKRNSAPRERPGTRLPA